MASNSAQKDNSVIDEDDDDEDDEIKTFIKSCSSRLKGVESSNSIIILVQVSGFPVFSGLLDECHDLVNDLVHQKVYLDDANSYYEISSTANLPKTY